MGIKPNPEADLLRNIIYFPVQTWLALLPGSLIILLSGFKNKFSKLNQTNTQNIINPKIIMTILLLTLVNFIPYWISSQSHIRYLLPLYPWFAILLSCFIWQRQLIEKAIVLLILTILIKYVTATLWFPYKYQTRYDHASIIAKDILQNTLDHSLYFQGDSAVGLSLAGSINQLQWPAQPVQAHPQKNKNYYFILKENSLVNEKHLRLIKTYMLENSKIDLYLFTNDSNISS